MLKVRICKQNKSIQVSPVETISYRQIYVLPTYTYKDLGYKIFKKKTFEIKE